MAVLVSAVVLIVFGTVRYPVWIVLSVLSVRSGMSVIASGPGACTGATSFQSACCCSIAVLGVIVTTEAAIVGLLLEVVMGVGTVSVGLVVGLWPKVEAWIWF